MIKEEDFSQKYINLTLFTPKLHVSPLGCRGGNAKCCIQNLVKSEIKTLTCDGRQTTNADHTQ